MNKKFSTLMAGLMLASAFSVSAQSITNAPTKTDKYVNGKYYMLGTDDNVLAVQSDATAGSNYAYGELKMVDLDQPGVANADWTLAQTREALWQVTITSGEAGNAPKYSFVNVATGMTLSVSIPTKNYSDISGNDKSEAIIGEDGELMISGGYMEWLNGGANSYKTNASSGQAFYSYVNNTDVVFLTYNTTDNELVAVRDKYNTMIAASSSTYGSSEVVKVQPYKAKTVALTAEDLNKELITNNDDEESFTLSFDQDVTEGAENLFTGVDLVATQLYRYTITEDQTEKEYITTNGELDTEKGTYKGYQLDEDYNYVRINVKDTKNYLVVDTALHTGSEADRQLPKFTYADPSVKGTPIEGNNVSRYDKAFNFKFAYEPLNNRVLIKVQEYPTRVEGWNGTPAIVTGEDGNDAYTYWPTANYKLVTNSSNATKDVTIDDELIGDAYVRLVTLSSVRELTVAFDDEKSDENYKDDNSKYDDWEGADDLTIGMLTTVTIGEGLMAYQPTTIDSGLYLIQFVKLTWVARSVTLSKLATRTLITCRPLNGMSFAMARTALLSSR